MTTETLPRGTDVVLDAYRVPPAGATGEILAVPLELVDVDANVRVNVASIEELAASIAEHGVRQPISLRDVPGDRYAINFGQRRYLASKLAGLATIPAFIDNEARTAEQLAIHQLVENLAREDLPPLDRARAMRTVVDAGMTQAELARQLGIGASTVTNDLGLLDAPEEVRQLVADGTLTPAHAKAMKGLAPTTQVEFARYVAQHRLSAHATEEEAQRRKQQAEREKEQRTAQAKESKDRATQLDASIDEFEAKKVGKTDPIVVSTDRMSTADAGHLASLIKAAGYENVRVANGYGEAQTRPTGTACDCTAWRASENVTYGRYDYSTGRHVGSTYRVSITKACIVRKHQQAKEAAAEGKRREKELLAERVQQHVRQAAAGLVVPMPAGTFIAVPRILAEAILWDALSYTLPRWAEAHGGKPNRPWTPLHALSDNELAKELAMKVASDFRDKAGYHVDWSALAEELLPKAEAPAAAPEPEAEHKRNKASAIAYGDSVVDELNQLYRVRFVAAHAVRLALGQPGWDLAAEVALADPSRLTWDKAANTWRGPVVAIEQPGESSARDSSPPVGWKPIERETPHLGDVVTVAGFGDRYEVVSVTYPPYATELSTVVAMTRGGGKAEYVLALAQLVKAGKKSWTATMVPQRDHSLTPAAPQSVEAAAS